MSEVISPARWQRSRVDLRSLWSDRSGLALLEFAFTLPLILAVGGWGIELSYMSLMQMRVSQYALNLADNASRVGVAGAAGITTLREADINDVLQGAKLDGKSIGLTTNGRITLSSLENLRQGDGTYQQRLHWQRCIGKKSGTAFASHYGTIGNNSSNGVPKTDGMGDPAVNAPKDAGVMFVEINYQYQPLFGTMFISTQTTRFTASYLVRDNRDFSKIDNPSPAVTPSSCDTFTE